MTRTGIVTEYDIELAKWNAKIAQIKADMQAMGAAAKKESIGDNLFGGMKDLLAGAGVALGLGAMKEMFNQVDDLADMSAKLNEAPEVLQRVGVAAKLSGSSIEGLVAAMVKLERGLGDVENGKARAALERYGFTAQEILSMPLDEKIIALSDAFQMARANGSGLADMQAMLGRSSAELIPLLSSSGDELRSMFAGVKTLSDDAVFKMALLNDQFDLMATNLETGVKVALWNLAAAFEGIAAAAETFSGRAFGAGNPNALHDLVDKNREAKEAARMRVESMRKNREAQAETAGKGSADDTRAADRELAALREKEQRIAALQRQIEDGRIAMLPDEEKITALGARLEGVFKKLRETADPFDMLEGGVKELMGLVSAMTADNPMYEDALKLVREAQQVQQQITGLRGEAKTETAKTAALPGSVAAAINSIFGRSANELIVDETKRQTQVLERIDKGIQKLAEGGQNPFAEDDLFSFP